MYNKLIKLAKLDDYKNANYYLEQCAEYPEALSDNSEQSVTTVNNIPVLKEINVKLLGYYGSQSLDEKKLASDIIVEYNLRGINSAEIEMLKHELSGLELTTPQHVEPLGVTCELLR